MFLFILCIQVLTNYINKNKNIQGIVVARYEIKQTLYADDATFFNNGSEKSFETLVDTLNNYAKCTGLYLNTNKISNFQSDFFKKDKYKIVFG